MEIKTKFNKGEEIHFMDENKPCKGVISGIEVYEGSAHGIGGFVRINKDLQILYYVHDRYTSPISEVEAYSSSRELQDALFNNQL